MSDQRRARARARRRRHRRKKQARTATRVAIAEHLDEHPLSWAMRYRLQGTSPRRLARHLGVRP